MKSSKKEIALRNFYVYLILFVLMFIGGQGVIKNQINQKIYIHNISNISIINDIRIPVILINNNNDTYQSSCFDTLCESNIFNREIYGENIEFMLIRGRIGIIVKGVFYNNEKEHKHSIINNQKFIDKMIFSDLFIMWLVRLTLFYLLYLTVKNLIVFLKKVTRIFIWLLARRLGFVYETQHHVIRKVRTTHHKT